MSIQLKSERAQQIQERLKVKQFELRSSIVLFRNSLSHIKATANEVKQEPISFLFPKTIESTHQHISESRNKVRKHPFSLVFTALGLGCLTTYLLSNNNQKTNERDLGMTFSNTMNSLLDKISRTSFANSIWSKIKIAGEEAIDGALGIKDNRTRIDELEKFSIYRDHESKILRYENGDARN